jgi:hypothetical protein
MRWFGSFRRLATTTADSSSGTSRRSALGVGGTTVRIAEMMSATVVPAKGNSPVRSWNKMTPRAQTSLRPSTASGVRTCSGDM